MKEPKEDCSEMPKPTPKKTRIMLFYKKDLKI